MKYQRTRKTQRDQALKEYRQAHLELSLDEIGKVFNISKQRVSKILLKGAQGG